MTQRKRATGFALMDTAFAADAKFVRLARRATPKDFAASVGVYWLMLADARRNRDRVVTWEDYTEYADEITALTEAGLLLEDGFPVKSFDRWAPAYKSPWDKGLRKDTDGYEAEPKDTQATPTSALLGSAQIASIPLNVDANDEPDGYVMACSLLGYFPASDDFRAEMTALDSEYGAEAVVNAVQQAFTSATEAGERLRPFDLKKAAHMILAEAKHRADKVTKARRRDELARSMADDVARQEREAWQPCSNCGVIGRKHPSSADHAFEVAA